MEDTSFSPSRSSSMINIRRELERTRKNSESLFRANLSGSLGVRFEINMIVAHVQTFACVYISTCEPERICHGVALKKRLGISETIHRHWK